MDESFRHNNPNPTLTANPLSKLLFWWLNQLFSKGYKGRLEESDMYNVCPDDSSKTSGEKIQAAWGKELERARRGGQPSLLKSLFRAYGVPFMLVSLIVVVEEAIKLCQPVLLAELIDYFREDSTTGSLEAWLYATGVVIGSAMLAITHHPYFFNVARIGMRIRVGLCSLMYRKCLRLSNKSLNESSVGQIVNLMSNDVARFDQSMLNLHFLWIGPLQCLVAVAYMWWRFGPEVTTAVAVVLLLLPTQLLMGKFFSKLRRKTAIHTDKRVKVMNEIISGIRIIKLYCWEKPFGRLVKQLRRLEVKQLRGTRRIQACVLGPFFTTSQLSIFLFILTYVLTDKEDEIRPGPVFLVMGVVQCLRLTCGLFVPLASQQGAETLVVIKRIQKFLLLEELKTKDSQLNGHSDAKAKTIYGVGVKVTNFTAKWDETPSIFNTLENVSLSVRPGELVAVIGPVGSGKTSLLMSILGELPARAGTVSVRGKIAYVSQHPWIFSGSLRQNILFGESFDKARYDKIIKICALSRDLSILPKGDGTLIGDRGVNLSGGQKARVSLARALYMDADIYLLDDPLAAVDTTVGKHIFHICIEKFLRDKPRILVTHQVQLLPVADSIVILTDGKVVTQGTFTELSKSGVNFSELLKLSEEETTEMSMPNSPSSEEKEEKLLETSHHSTIPESKSSRSGSIISVGSIGLEYVPEPVQLPEEEERETGAIDLQVFVRYFKAGTNIVLFVALVLLLLLGQIFYVACDWWLARWTGKVEDRHTATRSRTQMSINYNITSFARAETNATLLEIPEVDAYQNLYIFAALIAGLIIFALARAFLFFEMAVKSGKNLHNMMFARSLRVSMTFFDTNPVGRVLNRFSKDTGHIDDLLPWIMFDVLQHTLLTLGIVIVAAVLNPWVFIPVVPLTVLFVIVRKYYVQTSRSVKRLEGTTRSPVFSHLSATFQGLHTIRAMNMEQRLTAEFDSHQDLHTEAWFLFLGTSRWLGIRLDWLSVIFIACVVYGSVLAADSMDPGFVGLSVVYTMTLMGLFQWVVRQSVELENQMVSVERVLQYTRLPIEAELESKPGQKPPDTWPSTGSLQARGLSLRYSPSAPLVLKGIDFEIHDAEKIGIVGRTGAGKSSLITALFRLAEPEGELTIDGVSVHSLGLHDLRKAISIIPQDPVLFTGSVRRNLDPFDEYVDRQLWRALEEVQLKEAITIHPDNLYMEVTEGGSNFSAGQRQLMCLARAVLGNTRILVIDEATANVDPITDELIQQTIKTKFKTCTVLTIAHRLHTIIDSDRIMVLDAGELVEMNTPSELISSRGLFYAMVEQMGKAELEHLTELASKGQQTLRPKKPSPKKNGNHHMLTTTPTKELEKTNGQCSLNTSGVDNKAFTPDCREITRL